MIPASAFVEPLRRLGYSQYTGVPCSYLKPFINYVISDPALDYIGAASEGEAVGISMGAYLGGRKTVTMCQNSGLGNMVNPLTSLSYPFRIPTLLITTWRGEPGRPDEPQHVLMGQITHRLLETLQIPWLPFPSEPAQVESAMAQAEASMKERSLPFAFVMSEGTVAEHDLADQPAPVRVQTRVSGELELPPERRMIRTEALNAILESLEGNEAILATTGKTGRELFTIADRPNHIYVVGGMGTASAIGLGLARALPKQPVVVIDGDGAALMKMGSFATIGFYQPANLLHIVLDNEAHDSTGGQRTASGVVRFTEVAAATNYRNAVAAERREDVCAAVKQLRHAPGPSLLHIKLRAGSPKNLGRPTVKPHEVKERFMQYLHGAS
ncbi:MAG TPA: phosphonopyruvate decarboxylase [Verrucomicrobia bacterium]|nr:phosphonopyruvate decarboxylase [Verrucomicrobiota bacterium]HOP98817.1 phosphonopyruvate decarboxylase [Verrucomicrobiota bacterium]HPU56105.1 phosphonopyruvate decarboxylase [Verrucomicrobiota bacterium]